MATINGTSGADFLNGGAASDLIYGLDGDDNVSGNAGNDTVYGGSGDDTIRSGAGNDIVDGGAGNDIFSPHILDGHGDDYYIGGAGNDSFMDPLGKDTLLGGDGNDYFLVEIVKLTGSDEPFGAAAIATGGAGRDTYAMGQALWQAEEPGYPITYAVTDFDTGAGGDLIDVAQLLFASSRDGDYQGGNPFAASQGYLRLLQSGADTLLQHDLNGKGEGDVFATVLTLRNVTASTLTRDNFVGGINPNGASVAGDVLSGTAEADALEGGFFNDTISGGAGSDTLDGGGGNDVIIGGLGNDLIRGGPGNDTMQGNDGDDVFVASSAGTASYATGGLGLDTYVVRAALDGRGYFVTDFIAGVGGERIDVSDLFMKSAQTGMFNDHNLTPYTGGNPFDGTLGYLRFNDFSGGTRLQWDLDGVDGANFTWKTVLTLQNVSAASLTAENLFDIPTDGSMPEGETISGTTGDDSLRGGIADDGVSGDEGNDHLRGSAGNDTVDGGNGDDTLLGGLGDDLIVGGAGNDDYATIGGVPGVDHHVEQMGDDTIYGGDGTDAMADFWGNNWLDGGNDGDHFIVIGHDAGVSTMIGGGGADFISLGTTSKSMHHVMLDFVPGAGGDVLDVDQLLGASGFTTGNPFNLGFLELRQDGLDTQIRWDKDGHAGPKPSWKLLTLKNVAATSITSDNFFGQLVVGTDGNDDLVGGIGNDTVQGLAGNDTLDGSLGHDTLEGGSGDDLYYVDHVDDQVIETSNAVPGALLLPGEPVAGPGLVVAGITDTVIAAVNYSLANFEFVENLTLAGAAARGTGNELANNLKGNAGTDILDGAGGNDVLNGGTGNDSLNGGAGNDKLIGGAGNDKLVWGAADIVDGSGGTDVLQVREGDLDLTALPNTRIKNVEQIDLTGGGNNTLTVNLQDVLAISSSTDTLKVLGNIGDVVNAAGFVQGPDSGGFHRYTNGAAVLFVDTEVTVT